MHEMCMLLQPLIPVPGAQFHLRDIMRYLRSFLPAERVIFSEVVTLLKIIVVNPASNAVSGRSFFALRRLKNLFALDDGAEAAESSHVAPPP